MRRLVFVVTLAALLVPASPARAGNPINFHAHVTAAAELLGSTCPWYGPWDLGVECVDTFVLFFQEGRIDPRHGIFLPARRQPLALYVFETRYVVLSGHSLEDVEVEVLGEREGFVEDAPGSLDGARLFRAEVRTGVPMSDGSTLTVDLTWDLTGTPLNTAGIDGPIQEEGIPWGTHVADRCSTANWFAHQTWRWGGGSITGFIGEQDVSELSLPENEPFIGRGVFTGVVTEHGGCAA